MAQLADSTAAEVDGTAVSPGGAAVVVEGADVLGWLRIMKAFSLP